MSKKTGLTGVLIGLVHRHPGATVDDLLPLCAGCTRVQAMQSLNWAVITERLLREAAGGKRSGAGGSCPARYYPLGEAEEQSAPPPNSVWQYASREAA